MKVLVSNNSQLLQHLGGSSFRHLDIEVIAVSGGREAIEQANLHGPSLCVMDAEMPDLSGYQATIEIKRTLPATRVVLVLGTRINAAQMRLVADSGADEALVTPVPADHLYDVLAMQLGLPRRGTVRFSMNLAVIGRDGERAVHGRATNLSVDGVRLLLEEPVVEGTRIKLDIRPEFGPPLAIEATAVWTQVREKACMVGAEFKDLPPEVRSRLARLTLWEVMDEPDGIRVVIKGDVTEATKFDDLLPILTGTVRFDLSHISYMNSLGVREWVDLLARAEMERCELHACAVGFILQAALVEGVAHNAQVISFFAPYACQQCEHQEERLLQSAVILANDDRLPPVFACPICDGLLELDDVPARYLAFLPPSS